MVGFIYMMSMYMNRLSSIGSSPTRSKLMKYVNAVISLLSAAPLNKSVKHCAVKPSGPTDDPAGKVLKHFMTSSGETCKG